MADSPELSEVEVEPWSTPQEKYPRPDPETVNLLKAQSGTTKLMLVGFDTDFFVIRPILRQEWRAIQAKATADTKQAEQDLAVTEKVLAWPKKVSWSELPTGYPSSIFQVAMQISGFEGPTAVEEL